MTPARSFRPWVFLVVVAQGLVLAWIAAEREWIVRTGQVVYLRTAPIDPRDPFRGDFVRLRYEISTVALDHAEPVPPEGSRERRRDEVVYTRLVPGGEGVFDAVSASLARPADGLFIRGRTEESWRWSGGGRRLPVRYGIEQLYVEQGTGLAIEQRRGTREGVQVPMEVEVAISRTGTGVVRGYRWSPLGMKLEVVREPARRNRNEGQDVVPDPGAPLSPMVRLTLVNTSDAPVAVADTDDHCAFRLVSAGVLPNDDEPAGEACAGASVARVIVLGPGESHSVDLDLSEPRWHVTRNGKAIEVGALSEVALFRIEYRAPDVAAPTPGLWRGRLPSVRFNANGIVD